MENPLIALLTAILILFAMMVGLGAAELFSQLLLPVTVALEG